MPDSRVTPSAAHQQARALAALQADQQVFGVVKSYLAVSFGANVAGLMAVGLNVNDLRAMLQAAINSATRAAEPVPPKAGTDG